MSQSKHQPISPIVSDVKPGIYRHYKGNRYRVLSLAHHSETLEELVIYEALDTDTGVWARPLSIWNETVTVDGIKMKRFEKIE